MSEDRGKDIIKRYLKSFRLLGWDITDEKNGIYLFERENDYLVVTSKEEEFPLSYETLDKVRDILSGNMVPLTESEVRIFERYNSDWLLKTLAEESMLNHFKKEGKEIDPRYRIIFDAALSPNSIMSSILTGESDEQKKKEKIERFIKDNFGVKIDASNEPFTNLLIKLSSDQSYERKKFLKEALKKKKEE